MRSVCVETGFEGSRQIFFIGIRKVGVSFDSRKEENCRMKFEKELVDGMGAGVLWAL